ncbi:hypothetical protein [Streptomyces sp. NPDC047869]|uniref:hypothetical protein n=1 Tax=Streptomyces sp. NPDC047869 TaxID=3154709 RepID=UPI003451F697
MTVVFATAVVLYLTGSTFGEVEQMVAAVGGLAAVILASATGRIPVRAWIRKLDKQPARRPPAPPRRRPAAPRPP